MNNSPSSSTELRYTNHAKDRMSDPTPSNIKKQLIESSSRAVGGSIGYNSRTRNFKNIVKNDVQPRGAPLHKQLMRSDSPDLSSHFNFDGFRHAQSCHFI